MEISEAEEFAQCLHNSAWGTMHSMATSIILGKLIAHSANVDMEKRQYSIISWSAIATRMKERNLDRKLE
jgi:hypothetical protein